MTNSLQIRDLSPLAYAITRIGAKLMGANTASVFSPGQALQPTAADPPAQGPRGYQYPVAVNLNRMPRRDFSLTPFETLRTLAAQHPVAALCIRVRTEQISDLAGTVVAKRKKEQAALQGDCDAFDALFAMPDGSTPRSAWLKMLIRDVLEIDAPTVYKRPTQGGGVASLEVVDGATIKPVIDSRGATAGYQQILYGLALSQYLDRAARQGEEWLIGEYWPGELWYQPYWPTSTTPYGKPPMEDMLRLASIVIEKQKFDLAHFTDGNIPAALAVFDGQAMNPDQVLTFEGDFNADMQANPARVGYMKFVPFPVRVERLKELTEGGRYESAQEEFNVKITCAFYGVTPAEIGFTADINKATSEGQENVTYRRGIKPLASWLKTTLFDPTIQRDFGRSDLEWQWDYGETEDRLNEAKIDSLYYPMGAFGSDEIRSLRYPDLEGTAPGPPAPVAAIPGAPDATVKLLKVADMPPGHADREKLIDRLRGVIRAALNGQGERVIAAITDAGEQPDAIRTALVSVWPHEQIALFNAVLPLYDAAVASGLEIGAAQLHVQADYGMVNEAALKLAKDKAAWWASTAAHTSEKQIAQVLADWIETGGTMPDLLRRVQAISERWVDQRSDVGAVTAITDIFARANQQAWQASGMVSKYGVETSADERVCPICGPRQGTQYDIGDDRNLPPYHDKCRCWITPVVE